MDLSVLLPVLRKLSTECPSFYVYKHAADALCGRGDADCYVAEDELPAAEAVLRSTALVEGLHLWRFRYQPWAVTFLFVDSRGDHAELATEVDLNTAPTAALLRWHRGSSPPSCVFDEGVRIGAPLDEAFASLMYWHLGGRPECLPERELRALTVLSDVQLSELRMRIRSEVPLLARLVVTRLAERRHRLVEGSRSPVPWSLRLDRLAVGLTALWSNPAHLVSALTWRMNGNHRRLHRHALEFVSAAGRSIERLGGIDEFEALMFEIGAERCE